MSGGDAIVVEQTGANSDANKTEKNVPEPKREISAFRVILPQVLASTAKNLLILGLGMTIAFPTIVIPNLMKGKDPHGLTFTAEQSSWFGSVLYICQPLGSLASGIVLEPLGRKMSMLLSNIPGFVGWLLLLTSRSLFTIYLAIVIMGLGIGFMEAPLVTYIGEITQPHVRGTLTSYSGLFPTFGIFFIYILGTALEWRTVAGISMVVPVITALAISQVPESPLWLMSRGRAAEAEAALCWLRGWVKPEDVKEELAEIKRYSESTRFMKKRKTKGAEKEPPEACYVNSVCLEVEEKDKADRDPRAEPAAEPNGAVAAGRLFEELTFTEKVKDFFRPQMRRPLALILGFFFFSAFTGLVPSRPYMVRLMEQLGAPIEPYRANAIFGGIGFVGSSLCMATTAKFGRRPIALWSMLACSISGLLLAAGEPLGPWPNFVLFIILAFASYYGASGIVWTLVSEVFPFRGRSLAGGIAAGCYYIFTFLSTKTFLSLQNLLGVHGVFYFYGSISTIGLIFLYYLLPETEGRTLEDIEISYNTKKKGTFNKSVSN